MTKSTIKKLNIGIIGTGWPGQMHAQAVAAVAGANLYACADVDQERRGAFEKEYSPTKIYPTFYTFLLRLRRWRRANTSCVRNRRP